ncbi:MAG: hypothetical protein ACTSQC_06920 [Candidatus Heimdallarchaeaceae archaeon]
MTIRFASIMPHGFNLISEIYPDMGEEWERLSQAMVKTSLDICNVDPDVIVIASPHNLRIVEHIGIITSEWCEGTLWNDDKSRSVTITSACDRSFGSAIYMKAKENNLPVVAVNYGAASGEYSNHKMDWGTMIPLWFIQEAYKANNKSPPLIVLITPSREIPWDDLVHFGEIISQVSDEYEKEVVFIASADHAHAHDKDGPYGYDTSAKEYDKLIAEWIRKNKMDKLVGLSKDFIESAKPDSVWQMLILLGIIKSKDLKNKDCVYECPSYYGMIVASFQ